ncbi:MAG: hypothetical protein KatS3mg078_1815 [Deltaproteobacteria bacterium]|nr:MAG: hypothetical protein KatS3mg078_1815 [Deltaproteobacteria bacterium]
MKRIVFILLLFFIACSSKLPIKGEFPDTLLVDHNGKEFRFSQLRGNVVVVSYIYTHCPDICHIISAKMNAFKKVLRENNLEGRVYFVSITLDPLRDTPEVLKHHARMMNLDLKNWLFVTGDENAVYSTIEVAGMEAIRGPMSYDERGELSYLITHRDRITLVDREGRIRKHYKGTEFDPKELIKDIKRLL